MDHQISFSDAVFCRWAANAASLFFYVKLHPSYYLAPPFLSGEVDRVYKFLQLRAYSVEKWSDSIRKTESDRVILRYSTIGVFFTNPWSSTMLLPMGIK